ncbi:MAG: ribosome silencing factor [Muribaculaceae bacterium]|nr:ribosome silencing factor [Muribaculaceae bacterium]
MCSTDKLQSIVIEAIEDKKGQKITVIDLTEISSASASAFVICQGRTNTQVSSIADNIIDEVNRRLDLKPYHTDGFRNSQWVIIDYGDLVVHVFQPETREFYNLEELWSDGVTTDIPDPE